MPFPNLVFEPCRGVKYTSFALLCHLHLVVGCCQAYGISMASVVLRPSLQSRDMMDFVTNFSNDVFLVPSSRKWKASVTLSCKNVFAATTTSSLICHLRAVGYVVPDVPLGLACFKCVCKQLLTTYPDIDISILSLRYSNRTSMIAVEVR